MEGEKRMKRFISNLRKYNKYAIRSAKAELKSEVADSYLNWLWWIIEPFCFMVIYTFIFGVVFGNTTKYFASFVMVGQACWDFFNRMVNGSVKLIINNRDLVTKVYIPKYILLYSKSLTYLFKMMISLCLAFGLMAFQHVPLTWHIVLLIPIIFVLYVIAFGIGTILMHHGVTFNDLGNLVNIILKMVFYLSGIFFNINERFTGSKAVLGYYLLRVNPVAFIMNEARKVCIYGTGISLLGLGFWLLVGIILCVYGIRKIHKYENSYAKVI